MIKGCHAPPKLPSGKKLLKQFNDKKGVIKHGPQCQLLHDLHKPESSKGQPTIAMTMDKKGYDTLGDDHAIASHIMLGHEIIHAVNNKGEKIALNNAAAFENHINNITLPENIRNIDMFSTEQNYENTAYPIDLMMTMLLITRLEEFRTVGLAGDDNYDITEKMLCDENGAKARKTYSGLTPENTIPEIKERMKRFRKFIHNNPNFISHNNIYSSMRPTNSSLKVKKHIKETQNLLECLKALTSKSPYQYQLTEEGKGKLAVMYKLAQETCKEYGLDIPDL